MFMSHYATEVCKCPKNKEWLLDTTVYNFAGICRFYMGLAHEIKIVDSPEFLQYVQKYTDSFLNFKR